MSAPRIKQTTEQTLVFGHSVEARYVKEFVAGLPDDATITVSKYDGDPREPSETTISGTWSSQEGP